MTILIDPDAKKDEGDFTGLEMALSIVAAGRVLEKNREKSDAEYRVEQFRSFFQMMLEMAGREKRKLGFTGEYYVPYFREMQERGHTEAFAYRIHAGSPDGEVGQWLIANEGKVEEFLEWSQNYRWPSAE